MPEWPGIGERITACLRRLGYWKNDRPDVMRFAVEKGYPVTYLYKWLKDSAPERPNLEKLGEHLQVSPAWLLFGDEVSKEPARPRKRVRRALTCLVGALSLGVGPLWGYVPETHATGWPQVADNIVHYVNRGWARVRVSLTLWGFPRQTTVWA